MKFDIKTIVAIDPGYSGAIIIYSDKKIKQIVNPQSFIEILDTFKKIKAQYENIFVGIEMVHMNPSDTKQPGKAFNIQKMVRNYTDFLNAFDAMKLPYVEIHSRKWQRYLGLVVQGEDKKKRKDRYQQYAYFRFPNLKVTRRNQDALCILVFLHKVINGNIDYILDKCKNISELRVKRDYPGK